jgi:hypothetical protein
MNVGNLNFISQRKIVSIDLQRNPVQYGNLISGQICGSALTRNPVEKKEPKGKKYELIDNLEVQPSAYSWCYECVDVPYTRTEVLKSKDLFNAGLIDNVKKHKKVWQLKEPVYFYWHEVGYLPQNVLDMLIEIEPKKAVPFEDRAFKKMSHRTRSKIESKLLQWQSGVMEFHKNSPERCNFYFWTFTVPTRNFSHELTHKAWRYFLSYISQKHQAPNKPVNYLWVAELQSGKRSANSANSYFELMKRKDANYDHYKKKYDLFTQRALTPTNNVHYHMVVDRFYDIKEFQDLWLMCLEKQGCSPYTSTGKRAEPVDVQKVKNGVNGVSRYIGKYVAKNDGELKVQLWNCSRKISGLATSMADCYIVMEQIKAYYAKQENRLLTLC